MHGFFSLSGNLIEEMPWELQLKEFAGLSLDEMRFSLSFFVAIAASIVLRVLHPPWRKCAAGLGVVVDGGALGVSVGEEPKGDTALHHAASLQAWHMFLLSNMIQTASLLYYCSTNHVHVRRLIC